MVYVLMSCSCLLKSLKDFDFFNRILGGQIFIGAVTLQFQAKKVC